MLPGPIRIIQAVVKCVLGRQERDDSIPRRIMTEIRHQMAEVVFLLLPHRAIREKDVCVAPRESANGVIGIDPCVDPSGGVEFGAGRSKLGGDRPRGRRE